MSGGQVPPRLRSDDHSEGGDNLVRVDDKYTSQNAEDCRDHFLLNHDDYAGDDRQDTSDGAEWSLEDVVDEEVVGLESE